MLDQPINKNIKTKNIYPVYNNDLTFNKVNSDIHIARWISAMKSRKEKRNERIELIRSKYYKIYQRCLAMNVDNSYTQAQPRLDESTNAFKRLKC